MKRRLTKANRLLAVLLLFVLASCTDAQTAPANQRTAAISTTVSETAGLGMAPAADYEESDTANPAFDQLLQPFLQAVRAQDSQKLTDMLADMNPDYYRDYLKIDEAFMNRFLKMLGAEIDPGTIQAELHETGERQATYKITGTKNGGDPVAIADMLYVSLPQGSEKPSLDWSYIRYLPYAEGLATEYIRLIQAGNAEQLARFSVVDDVALTTANAKKLIAIYAIYFDHLKQAELIYAGGFQFEVRDGSDNRHTFRIGYGDGLMGIEDTFAPAMTSL
ncbi:hypothetical protein [Paenibacillus xanthanilyticus]|uniref:Uncharacterized protein n=1 Tax=Paenibacillus xanthanilyticus TaxID=1783531 RepID=A0ABV8K8Y3_9BACL